MIYSLIVLVAALAADRYLPDRNGFNPFSWFRDWLDSVEQRFNGGESRQGFTALALTVGSVFLVVLLIQFVLAEINFLFRLGFDIALMYFFLNLNGRLKAAARIAQAVDNDETSVAEEALKDLPPVVDEPHSDADASWTASLRILVGSNSWFFAPVFWFMILGPAGAVLHYIADVAAQSWDTRKSRFQEFGRSSQNLFQVLNWIPVRLLAISYALLGDFENVIQVWQKHRDTWTGSANQLLAAVGFGALGQDVEEPSSDGSVLQRTVSLQYRVIAFWVAAALLLIAWNVFHR